MGIAMRTSGDGAGNGKHRESPRAPRNVFGNKSVNKRSGQHDDECRRHTYSPHVFKSTAVGTVMGENGGQFWALYFREISSRPQYA